MLPDLPENVPLDVDVVLCEVDTLFNVLAVWHRMDVNQVDLDGN